MKKVVAFILALVLTLSLFGCDTNTTQSDTPTSSDTESSSNTESDNSSSESGESSSLNINSTIENPTEIINSIIQKTKYMEYENQAGGGFTITSEDVSALLEILGELEITSMTTYNGDIEFDSEETIYYFYDTIEQGAPHFAEIGMHSKRILFFDGANYVFEASNIEDVSKRFFSKFYRLGYEHMISDSY
jgi:hypothetical protein